MISYRRRRCLSKLKPAFLLKRAIILLLAIFISSDGLAMSTEGINHRSFKEISAANWQKLSQKTIYFGHQSVGNNILAGMKEVLKENAQIRLSLNETTDTAILKPSFIHSSLGKNKDPYSKIDAFAALMEHGMGNNADYAFLKLCFVDITATTDIEKVFNHYKATLARLKEVHPKTVFLHFTVPLMTVQKGPKVWLKRIIGRPIGGYADNAKRTEYNNLIMKEYAGKEPVFDLAAIESTYPNGQRESFIHKDMTCYALVPEYTHDGGHLNDSARKMVAEQLLLFLAELSAKSR